MGAASFALFTQASRILSQVGFQRRCSTRSFSGQLSWQQGQSDGMISLALRGVSLADRIPSPWTEGGSERRGQRFRKIPFLLSRKLRKAWYLSLSHSILPD